ncbi:retrotransposon protein, putative, ty1-copia subclass [Tanacetum coccineum]|uniref:Retrotransposon protein, putative, ty1-copia subclass n=1 Tax=Tanacetum coccineum TaxID=301880 RepID=A0ABQ5CS43_9ASTR
MVRSMMNLTTLPLSFWDYALESATRILNMVPTKKVDKTPYELWYGKVPNLSYLKVWGCEALVKRDTPDKLEQRSVKYAEFFEKRLINQEISGRAVDLEEIQEEEDTTPSEITSNIPQEVEGFEPPQEEVIPIHFKSNKWIDAMNAEIQSMMDNMVWVLVDLPPGCKTVGSKWLFKKKTDMDGIVHVYKARLVAKILISIAAYYDYEIWQMDVKTAFLNGYLDEDIYMVQPEGFVDPNHPRKVAKPPKEVNRMKNVPYASAVGPIMYAVRCTRPDVAFTQNMTSRFQQNSELRVECYCDAGFETDRDDTKSQTGYVFVLNGGAVDWKSSKQSTTAMSATESEYIAASEAAMEAIWIRKFISGLGICNTPKIR